ncbi:hypothetical protein ACHAQE_009905 [Botrytis cinerea]
MSCLSITPQSISVSSNRFVRSRWERSVAETTTLVSSDLIGLFLTSSATPTVAAEIISTDVAVFENFTTDYYVGFKGADFDLPYAKYHNPNVAMISDALANGLAGSPWPSAFTYSAWEAHKYLELPGYLQLENGWAISPNGTLMITVRSEIPEVETQRYKLWNPVAHQYSYRTSYSENWSNETYAERCIGATSYIDEYVGNDAAKLNIEFVDPSSMGFNTTAWPELDIETIVIGKVLIGDYSVDEFDGISYLIHQVRRMPNGYRELRSRFFLDSNNHVNAQLGHDPAVHCNVEMTHLGKFLPARVFEEFKDTK